MRKHEVSRRAPHEQDGPGFLAALALLPALSCDLLRSNFPENFHGGASVSMPAGKEPQRESSPPLWARRHEEEEEDHNEP